MLSTRRFLNGRQPVLECVMIAWHSAPDAPLTGMPAILYLESSDDFRLFYQRHVRLLIGQNIRTSFGQVQKNGENFSGYFGTLYQQ